MNKEDIKRVWQEVQDNNRRLEQCSVPHDFVQHDSGVLPKWKCVKCGGVVSNSDHCWYIRGLEHAKKNLE